ncbi:hypothetical protein C8J57DRAFT_1286821 [Mycena rebaudengoi]|nr:hypothetical protein C8J57DRAFT_1286821 [Mycena rebaudengoi]
MDAYKITDNTDILLKKTFGKFSHRFILIEIGTSPLFFARIDFQGDAPLGDQPITQSIILSTDRTSIAPASVSFARMSNPNPGGPTLDAFATLLEIMHRRTYKYDLFSRNCFWMSETILYATGRRYSDYWRAANIEPPPLRRYVEYAIGANTATVEIHHNEPAERFFVDVGLQIVKGIQWLFSYPAGESRIRFPDEEVEGILSEWK